MGKGTFLCEFPREHEYWDPHGRQWLAAPCETLGCGPCRIRAVRRRSAAIALAAPERYAVITGVPPDYGSFSPMRRRLERSLEQRGFDLGEWCATLEINPRRTGHHVNLLRRGDEIPRELLSELAERSGFGWKVSDDPVISPVAVGGYVLSDAIDDDMAPEFLAANNGRLTHSSRGFFRDDRGQPVTAERADDVMARLQKEHALEHMALIGPSLLSSLPTGARGR